MLQVGITPSLGLHLFLLLEIADEVIRVIGTMERLDRLLVTLCLDDERVVVELGRFELRSCVSHLHLPANDDGRW